MKYSAYVSFQYVRNRNQQEEEFKPSLLRSQQNQLQVCGNMKLLSLPTIALLIQYHIKNLSQMDCVVSDDLDEREQETEGVRLECRR